MKGREDSFTFIWHSTCPRTHAVLLLPWDSVDNQRTRILTENRARQNDSADSTRIGQRCSLNLPLLAGHPKLT